jgi:NADH-quinone oxidoreductase subunit G
VQSFEAVVEPKGLARPGWKILRVLGTQLGVDGFGYLELSEVRTELGLSARVTLPAMTQTNVFSAVTGMLPVSGQLWRLAEMPIYRVDPIVRRAPALQRTADNPGPVALLHPTTAQRLGIEHGQAVRVVMQEGEARVKAELDTRMLESCVWVPAGYPETAALGAHGVATVMKEGA